jgi:serpin B
MNRLRLGACLLLLSTTNLAAQESPELTKFIAANDKFGRKLLREVHGEDPNRNVAISPLPVSYLFGAIREGSVNYATINEITDACEWRNVPLPAPSRLLSEAFRPIAVRPSPTAKKGTLAHLALHAGPRSVDGAWMRTAFIYRGHNMVSASFLKTAADDFDTEVINVATRRQVVTAAKEWWTNYIPTPTMVGPSDFYAVGMVHLEDVWRGNTFSVNTTHKGDFVLRSAQRESVDMMRSEMGSYSHGQTDSFEAVILDTWSASLLVVVPKEVTDILELEDQVAKDPTAVDAVLKPELGDVELPKIKFQFEADLASPLQRMGVKRVFSDLDVVNIPKSHLKQVAQKVDLEINEQGIRANAGMVVNGVYGGVMGGMIVPFHMRVNRPFLFFIRDHLTNSLLFLGAVMDPAAR